MFKQRTKVSCGLQIDLFVVKEEAPLLSPSPSVPGTPLTGSPSQTRQRRDTFYNAYNYLNYNTSLARRESRAQSDGNGCRAKGAPARGHIHDADARRKRRNESSAVPMPCSVTNTATLAR
jgi:hypothetical protein